MREAALSYHRPAHFERYAQRRQMHPLLAVQEFSARIVAQTPGPTLSVLTFAQETDCIYTPLELPMAANTREETYEGKMLKAP
jgi:hypothetical protein